LDARRAAFADARHALALAGAALLALVVLLVGRVWGLAVAALAGVQIALDPWLVAHGQVLHLDGLFTALLAISALACLARWQRRGGLLILVLGGVAAGLAALTKSAALVLLPAVLLAVAAGSVTTRANAGRTVLELCLLAAIATLTALLAWPALLSDPLGTALAVLRFGEDLAGQAHESGSYFLGHPTDDPGPLFYPLVLAFRLSPVVLLGLVCWAVELAARRRRRLARDASVHLAIAAVLVVVAMALVAKKQDRYVLPAVPLLAAVAAVGYRRASALLGAAPAPRALALGAVGIAQLVLCAGARPYYFAAYSPLLGGAGGAQSAIPVGWGEGLDLVAAHLNRAPEGDALRVGAPATVRVPLRSQVHARVEDPDSDDEPDYLLAYVSDRQRTVAAVPPRGEPVLVVRIGGAEYATLYVLRDAERSAVANSHPDAGAINR
jgi:4-amino-4-deoxy-L-arabinose transferase-like glycosyltransferase